MSAEPQHLAHRRVERAEITVAADAQHGVVAALAAQRAVAELGGQRGVPAGEPALRDQLRQQQVGVGVAVGDGQQHVERYPAGRIPACRRPGADRGWRRRGPRRSRRHAGRGSGHVSRAPPRRPGAAREPSRRRASAACRPPGRRRARPGVLPVPARTRSRCTRSSPGGQRRGRARSHRPAAPLGPACTVTGHSLTRTPVQLRPRARLGRARPDLPVDRDGGLAPVNLRVGRGDLRRQADAVGGLLARLQLTGLDPVQRRHQQLGARRAQPVQQVPGGVRRPDRLGQHAEHRPRVKLADDAERRRAGDIVAMQDRVLHRGGPAPGRQNREVQVDPAMRRDVERRLRDAARRRRSPGSSPGRSRAAWPGSQARTA